MSERASFHATVHGRVQGVNFRFFVSENAEALGLTGYVKNLSEGRALEVYAEGDKDKLERLLDLIRVGSSRAKVERVDVEWSQYRKTHSRFMAIY